MPVPITIYQKNVVNYLAGVPGILEDWEVGNYFSFPKESGEAEGEKNDEDNNGDEDGEGHDDGNG